MRFLALDLRDYGPFRQAPVLDLSGGARGLHLIVGPNEAGKSTALRAIRALLFDYPRSTPDDHGRDPAALRVGGTLRDEAGNEIAFLRRKRGTKLVGPDDKTMLPAGALESFLGTLDDKTFEDLFSLDHRELVNGGRLIAQGKGRLGEMLFSAGTGLAQLDRVRVGLQEEMDKLYKTRNATLPAINRSLNDLKAAREVSRAAALPTADWVDANARLGRAEAARADVSRRQRAAQAEVDRWRAWLGAVRVAPRRREVLDRLASRGDRAVLRAGFAEAYRAESEAGRAAARARADARDALALAEAELARLGPPDPALLDAEAIGRLHADLGRYASARRDRPGLATKLDRAEGRARALRAELPAGAAVPASGLAALRDPIQTLAQEHAALRSRREDVEAELARLAAPDTDPAGGESTPPDALRWLASLEDAIARATAPGDLDAQRLEALGELLAAEDRAATALQGLTLWSGTLDDLAALAIPPDATFDRFEEEVRAAGERVHRATAEGIRLENERIALDREADRARVAGAIPTEDDLAAHRGRRDSLWGSIRRAWVDREPLAPAPGTLADDFEAQARRADALADSLRREAERVAADAQRRIDRRALTDGIALQARARAEAEADRAAALAGWAAHWRPLGIEPLPPREMKLWAGIDRKERLRAGKAVRDARAEVARVDAQADALRAELGHALARVGEPPLADGESLAALLARGRLAVGRIGDRLRREAAGARLAEVNALEVAWRDRWGRAVAPLGLAGDAPVSAARGVVDRLDEWVDAAREARAVRDGIADLDAIVGRFAAEARALAGRLDPDLVAGLDAEDDWQPTAAALADRLNRAAGAKARRETWLARLDEERTRLAGAQAAASRAGEALVALAAEAGCRGADDLPAAIRTAGEAEADRADLRRLDEQLDGHAGALTRAALLEAIAGLDEATLLGRIAEAGAALVDLEAESHRLGEEIGAGRARIAAMRDGPGAFEAEQAVHDHAARLGGEVEKYARLKLAAAVLRDAVERHRAKHQGPVLDRAGALFARLTAGSFVGLQADQDDKGEPILKGVRAPAAGADAGDGAMPPVGPLVDVAAMSEGTADQLYLALRLASLAVHLDDHEPAPLVADDILVNCDDARARAALEALAELSSRTQVLFFTHHDHLAEIARACLPAEALFVHRLAPPAAPGAAPAPPPSRRRRVAAATPADP